MNLVIALAVGVLFGVGAQLMVHRDAIRLAGGTLILTNAAVLLLMASGFAKGEAPLVPTLKPEALSDPLGQAMALTALVISLGTTVLLVRVVLAVERSHDSVDLAELTESEIAESAVAESEIAESAIAESAVAEGGLTDSGLAERREEVRR